MFYLFLSDRYQALAISGYVLQIAGYVSPEDNDAPSPPQPKAVILALRVMLTLVPALFMWFSMIFNFFYPLSQKRVEEIRLALAAKKRESRKLLHSNDSDPILLEEEESSIQNNQSNISLDTEDSQSLLQGENE